MIDTTHLSASPTGLPMIVKDRVGQDGEAMLASALTLDPPQRPTAEVLLAMPYFATSTPAGAGASGPFAFVGKLAAPPFAVAPPPSCGELSGGGSAPLSKSGPELSGGGPAVLSNVGTASSDAVRAEAACPPRLSASPPGSEENLKSAFKQLEDLGCVVVRGVVPSAAATSAHGAIRSRVTELLRGYGQPCSDDFRELLNISKRLNKAPAGWHGAAFGCIDKLGWIQKVGSGRMFDGWDSPEVTACRESTRQMVAAWHKCDPEELASVPERCSVKPPGSAEFPAHLDQHRRGTLQVIIALTPTSFVVWPKSHLVAINPGGSKYYALTKQDVSTLEQEGCRRTLMPAQPGDVMLMVGGEAGA